MTKSSYLLLFRLQLMKALMSDIAQLAIFIQGVDETLTITEEYLELVPMKDTTTANDIFSSLVGAKDKV